MADDNAQRLDENSSDTVKATNESGEAEKAETPADVNELTPEEQMARFEEDLKNSDWGHQPC